MTKRQTITPEQAREAAEQAAARAQADEDATLPEAPAFPRDLAAGPLRELMDWADDDGLPVSFVAAAGEAVLASAAAGRGHRGATLTVTSARVVMPVLWIALIGASGEAKNPPIRIATAPVTDYYAALLTRWEADREAAEEAKATPDPRPPSLMQSSVGIEAMARWLAKTDGSGLLRNGELGSFLKGLGQYKSGGGSDRYDAMDMWSSEQISIERVGGGGRENAVQVQVPCPRMSILGGLVPENVQLLGSESDGLRARFLPVLASSQVIPNLDGSAPVPPAWAETCIRLLDSPGPREWTLKGTARELIRQAITDWTARRIDGADPVVVKTALAKADEQALRIALVMAESDSPGTDGGEIPEWAAVYAIARVEYSLGVWAALGSDQVMTFTRKDEVLSAAVTTLLRAVEARTAGPDGRKHMTRRDIHRANVAGATTPDLTDTLIRAYLAAYPGCVTVYTDSDASRFPMARRADRQTAPGSSRGPAGVVVWAPARRPQDPRETVSVPCRKLSVPTVSGKLYPQDVQDETAGQSVTPRSDGARKLSGAVLPDSFQPTVSSRPGSPPAQPRASQPDSTVVPIRGRQHTGSPA